MKVKFTIGISVLVLAIVCLIGWFYERGHHYYQQGVSALSHQNWTQAKEDFSLAHEKSILFFGDWMATYQGAVNAYGRKQLESAEKDFQSGQFKSINSEVAHVSKDFTDYSQVKSILAINPMNINVNTYVPQYVSNQKVQYFSLSPGIPAIVITGADQQFQPLGDGDLYILVFDPKGRTYKVDIEQQSQAEFYLPVIAGKLFGDNRTALVVQREDGGSGGYADASVYALSTGSNPELESFLTTAPQFEGSFAIKKNQLIVTSGDLTTAYTWDGSEFLGKQVFSQPVVTGNSVAVHYSIDTNDNTVLNPSSVTLHVGQSLVLIRDDQNQVNDRILFDDNGVLDSQSSHEYTAQQPGQTSISIIPGGYDWSNSQNIMVTVIK